MSSREHLENSLPYWVFEHLGEKSVMMDKVNQLPKSPREDPLKEFPTRDDTSIHIGDSRIDISSPLGKEINVMTQDDLDRLRENYSFPAGIQSRIPKAGETILSTRLGEIAFYEVAFPAGLKLPIHPTVIRILNFYNICPAQLSPNAWKCVVCVLVI